ncbi:hypothetical protein BDW66DRAFT_163358 [Aspergillus desertorum]
MLSRCLISVALTRIFKSTEFGITTDRRIENMIIAPEYDNVTACAQLPGMDKVLVILNAGATEALKQIYGMHVHDILAVSAKARNNRPRTLGSTTVYVRLGAMILLQVTGGTMKTDPMENRSDPGWRLDKWKFVPIIEEALLVGPEAHWYIFIEADTYIVWRNMVRWLSQLDQEKALYLGAPMQIGVKNRKMTANDCAGDHLLGRIISDIGVQLVWPWPLLVPSSVWEFEYFTKAYGRRRWCYPTVSSHHQWFRYQPDVLSLHKDIFKWELYGTISSRKDDWDNLSSGQQPRNNSGSPTHQ